MIGCIAITRLHMDLGWELLSNSYDCILTDFVEISRKNVFKIIYIFNSFFLFSTFSFFSI